MDGKFIDGIVSYHFLDSGDIKLLVCFRMDEMIIGISSLCFLVALNCL